MSDWINFVKQFAHDNDISYGEALKTGAAYYKKGRSKKKMKKGGYASTNEEMYRIGERLGEVFGGDEKAPKGALAALLSGLDARVTIA